MSKRKTPTIKPRLSSDARGPAHDESPPTDIGSRHLPSSAAIRETIEVVVIAFAAVFVFRTFAVEAFVIPTGSMAPTLMGCHKDIVCPKCKHEYQVSQEVTVDGAPKGPQYETVAGTCPMCRYTALLGEDNPQQESYPSCNGDRVEVSKLAYQISEPERWDVIVFRYPGDSPTVPTVIRTDSRTNFIKRLVGLPGETIRIQHGDLWVRQDEGPFHIARKPLNKLLAMLQPVFNNDYMPRIAEYGWPARWQSGLATDGSTVGAWYSDDGATFQTDGTATNEMWLRYHHLIPSYQQWQGVELGKSQVPSLRPQLITDFAAYNTARKSEDIPARSTEALGVHWVGDLAIGCTVEFESPSGKFMLELCEGGRRFQSRVDVETGRATLSISGQDMEDWRPTAPTNICCRRPHDIMFSNCDNELLLTVDGNIISFDVSTVYPDLGNIQPDNADLEPVGIATIGAKMQVSHLRVLRDVFYGALCGDCSNPENHDVLYFPGRALPNEPRRPLHSQQYVDFALASDQFFVLGDNSACSRDGRLWGAGNYWVPRNLLIGRALVISWPRRSCNIPFINVPFPFFPSFGRMGLVR